ncbi:MAG: NYN domain-containing protein [Thermomicrobiales bacterium]|nr:NYN domain-containing protein [Thermomicrobiales bacterium]
MPPQGRPRAIVYFDGFNFYNGCFNNLARPHNWRKYKWLDLGKYCQLMFPALDIVQIRYFTARLKPTPVDPDAPAKQHEYLRALCSIEHLTLHEGQFLIHKKRRYAAEPAPSRAIYAEPLRQEWVVIPEEKGSDVNLATWLVADAFRERCDIAVIVSNDSDLAAPLRLVCEELGRASILLNPQVSMAWHLTQIPNVEYRKVTLKALAAAQFPVEMTDAHGRITRPEGWG